MNPETREELFLNAIASGETGNLPSPETRKEVYLNAIATSESSVPDPQTREEVYLYAKATGNTDDLPAPETRQEVFLNGLALGDKDNLPDPLTREEYFVKEAAGSGGGGGSGTLEESGWVRTVSGKAVVSGNNVDMPSGSYSTGIEMFPKGADKFANGDELVIAITVNSVAWRLQANPNNLNDRWSSATGLFRSRNRSVLFADSTGSDVLTWNFTADSTQGLKINPTNNSGTTSKDATANFDITGIKYNGETIFGTV